MKSRPEWAMTRFPRYRFLAAHIEAEVGADGVDRQAIRESPLPSAEVCANVPTDSVRRTPCIRGRVIAASANQGPIRSAFTFL